MPAASPRSAPPPERASDAGRTPTEGRSDQPAQPVLCIPAQRPCTVCRTTRTSGHPGDRDVLLGHFQHRRYRCSTAPNSASTSGCRNRVRRLSPREPEPRYPASTGLDWEGGRRRPGRATCRAGSALLGPHARRARGRRSRVGFSACALPGRRSSVWPVRHRGSRWFARRCRVRRCSTGGGRPLRCR